MEQRIEQLPANLIQPVYHRLKQMIESGELKPGEKIRQEKMAMKMGISRTPLIKALHMLEQEFLVENRPRRGMYVRTFNERDLLEAFECRYSIEITAVRLLARRITQDQLTELTALFAPFHGQEQIDPAKYEKADRQFHSSLIRMCGNKYLDRMESMTSIQAKTYQRGLVRKPGETLAEHEAILKGLAAKRPDEAEQALRQHIRLSIKQLELEALKIKL